LIFLFVFYGISSSDDVEKYRLLREECQRNPSKFDCIEMESKFLQLIKKCQKLETQKKAVICKDVKAKLCAVFPKYCVQTTKKIISTTRPTPTKSKLIRTTKTTPLIITTKTTRSIITTKTTPLIITTKTTRSIITTTTSATISNEEFVKVPIDPDELRNRGEYCVRHGKEKKCQELLNNLKTTYSSCSKKKPSSPPTKPEQLDCHSFESHMCKAFPKFPPCLKKTPKLI